MLFSEYIVWYLFLGGLGSGTLLVAVLLRGHSARRVSTFNSSYIEKLAYGVSSAALFIAMLMLFIDLGKPQNLWYVFENPFRSVQSFGAWAIVVSFLCSTGLCLHGAKAEKTAWARNALCIVGAPASLVSMTYTGLLLSSMVSVDFWHTGWLVALFVISSLSSGVAAMGLLAFAFSSNNRVPKRLVDVSVFLIVLELAVLLAFLCVNWFGSTMSHQSCVELFFGQASVFFWAGCVFVGYVIPLVVVFVGRVIDAPVLNMVSAVSTIGGSLALRYCVIAAAVMTPLSTLVA